LCMRGFYDLPVFGIQFKGTGIVLTHIQFIRKRHIYAVAGHNSDTHVETQIDCPIY
jgi:hypothetical protein